ncbi:MAG TPA: FtsW/RodA/SpoVE family cell cycle protein [Pirellulales bacterium]|jgi:cell division protein FtsW (lipid II flippase)
MEFSQWMRRLPWSIVFLAMCLVALGCLGIDRSDRLWTSAGGRLGRQLLWAPLCFGAMFAATLPNYRVLIRWSYAAFAISLVLLLVVYWFPAVNGARRWIRVGPVGFQPSEFAKLAFVLGLARYLMYRDSFRNLPGLVAPLLLALVPVVLVLREPDLGTALVFLPVLFVMLFAAGARRRHLAVLVVLALAVLPLLWTQMSREQKSRVTALAEQTSPSLRPTADGYHLHQAKQVLSLGGWCGSSPVAATDERTVAPPLPEPHTDSIAIVLGERFGLAGWFALLCAFWMLSVRGFSIAEATREPYGRLVAIGLVALLSTQVLINTGMLVGLLPITGLALPLVSYGGSSLLANLLALGLLLNVGLRPGYEVSREPFSFAT